MADEKTIGYPKEEYYNISLKHGLPKRCPILADCCRAVLTRYEMGFRLGGNNVSFEEFVHSTGQRWEPEKMIKEIEIITWSKSNDIGYSIENVCPEVALFEDEYLPRKFRQSGFGSGSYDKELRRFEAEAKHYSECAEFSQHLFKTSKAKMKGTGAKVSFDQIPEKKLEDYLTNNLEVLESGLNFISPQKSIGKWAVDIFASDAEGNDVLIELKSKKLNREEIHNLAGQVSKYFNALKKKANNLRLFVVLPRINKDKEEDLCECLRHWIENNRVSLYYFDYLFYEDKFVFTKIKFK